MIICHCEVVSDHEVVAALDDGATTLAQVCQMTGAGLNCGGCIPSLTEIMCQHGPSKIFPRLEVA